MLLQISGRYISTCDAYHTRMYVHMYVHIPSQVYKRASRDMKRSSYHFNTLTDIHDLLLIQKIKSDFG